MLRSVDDLSSAKVDLRFVNPQTGPFHVEGAMTTTLIVELIKGGAPGSSVVDANYSVVVKAAKALLPAAGAFGGLHAELRERARSLAVV